MWLLLKTSVLGVLFELSEPPLPFPCLYLNYLYICCIYYIYMIFISMIEYQQELFCDPERVVYKSLGMISTLSTGSSKLPIDSSHSKQGSVQKFLSGGLMFICYESCAGQTLESLWLLPTSVGRTLSKYSKLLYYL